MSSSAPAGSLIVRLEQFEGPLDLLLGLIERRELEITAVSVAAVADQYLEALRRLDPLPADDLAAFLVIAGKLLYIKSRALLPPDPVATEDEAGDPAEELAERLREYHRFRLAARALAELEAQGQRTYPRTAPPPALAPPQLAPLPARALVHALDRLLATFERRLPADAVEGVPSAGPTVPERIALIEALVRAQGRVPFSAVIATARTRREIVVGFLALLELLKAGRVAVAQSTLFDEIWIEPLAPSPEPAATGAPPLATEPGGG